MALKGIEFKRGRHFISKKLEGGEEIEYMETVVGFQAEARELHPCREMEPVVHVCSGLSLLPSFLRESACLPAFSFPAQAPGPITGSHLTHPATQRTDGAPLLTILFFVPHQSVEAFERKVPQP